MIAMRDILEVSGRIAADFHPQKIILFGSHAYGRPTRDSDVDLLVIMPYRCSETGIGRSASCAP